MHESFEVFVVEHRKAANYVQRPEGQSAPEGPSRCSHISTKCGDILKKFGATGRCLILVLGTVVFGVVVAIAVLASLGLFYNDASDGLDEERSTKAPGLSTLLVTSAPPSRLSVTAESSSLKSVSGTSSGSWSVREHLKTIDYEYETDDYGNESLVTLPLKKRDPPATHRSLPYCESLGEWGCLDGRCIDRRKRCNGRRDCARAEDEKSCSCTDFLNETKICDLYPDCPKSEDEIGCNYECPDYRCSVNGMCIEYSKVCDGAMHCSDGEDERNCWILSPSIIELSLEEILERKYYVDNGFLAAAKYEELAPVCSDGWTPDYGRIVCQSLGYNSLIESSQSTANSSSFNNGFLRVTPAQTLKDPKNSSKDLWSRLEQTGTCENRHVVRLRCGALECGKAPECAPRRRRIVGGKDAGGGCHPWAAALYRDGELTCQAVVLNHRWLLTAAHCFTKHTIRHWVARLGFYRQLSRGPDEEVRRVEGVIWHPNYTSTPLDTNDIALIRMGDSVGFGPHIRPPCLPRDGEDHPRPGDRCTVIGWGFRTEKGRVLVDSLQSVRLPTIDPVLCNRSKAFEGSITDGHLCLSDGARKMDACQGDSGGALLCDRRDGSEYLAGITSTGFGCARPDIPGIWTRLSKYIHWVTDTIEKAENSELNVVSVGARYPCSGFQCRLGDCVYSWLQCDGQKDCLTDGSDEDKCS